jgi:alpha,alpha-trehalose-phosphate synthase [UDP-forming]
MDFRRTSSQDPSSEGTAAPESRRWERRLAPLGPFDGPNRRKGGGRLVIASNRLPVVLSQQSNGEWETSPASGGLVTALDPVMRRRSGLWVGWSGAVDVGQAELRAALNPGTLPYELRALELSREERDRFYRGFANQVLWPLFHGFTDRCNPDPRFWETYRTVNRRFAAALSEARRWDDLIWVHDYHLMLVAEYLRELGVDNRLAFFLHIPFPRPEQLERLPWHREIVRGLLHYDLVGFQAPRDRANFLEAVRRFLPEALPGSAEEGEPSLATSVIRSGAFPISIDFDEFAREGSRPEVEREAERIRRSLGDRTLVLGVDRLDYTKGIPEKLRGFRLALQRFPELRGSIVLKQLVVPSRERITAYAETKAAIEALVQDINDAWADEESDWTPVHYRYGMWNRTELLAHYRAADVALVTPLNDGMNLVAKEFCAVNRGDGVLILSAFAGAAADLGYGGLLVNPAAPEAVARAIHAAFQMPETERKERMTAAREAVRANHVHQWVRRFLEEGARAGP